MTGLCSIGVIKSHISGVHEKPVKNFLVTVSWNGIRGGLYWETEVPTFWHSRKDCEKIFGHNFANWTWHSLLPERSFDHLEGRGAWQYVLKIHGDWIGWNDENRKPWLKSMVDRWKSEEEGLRHSRKYCIEQYGTNFVRERLPQLLRDFDGLPEDEITELTQEGPDLVPPSPVISPERLDNGDGDGDGDGDIEADEEDGWETADEG